MKRVLAGKARPQRAPRFCLAVVLGFGVTSHSPADTTEFCLDGELDLGARYQGLAPEPGEFHGTRWCVITDDDTQRVRFRVTGPPNPDVSGDFTVVYLPPDRVRIVTGANAPDLDFVDARSLAEARRHRRIDPRRLSEELSSLPDPAAAGPDDFATVRLPQSDRVVAVRVDNGRVRALRAVMPMPLRGLVEVGWRWDWSEPESPRLTLSLDGQTVFRARGRWRELDDDEAALLWRPAGESPPREIPGINWPSRVNMRLEELAEGVYRVRNVRTGFHHLVVDTEDGLVVGDAPAGWVELHQIPPADLVGPLGVSGLSEAFVDFLREEIDRPIRAVVLTHAHDDHAGGARAFAAAGAEVYAPASVAAFLEAALNRERMPGDRLSRAGGRVEILPVEESLALGDGVRLVPIGPGPHVADSIGLLASEAGLFFQSDLHVPGGSDDAPAPDRARSECWFADWAVNHLPVGTEVLNSHSLAATSLEQFQGYLDSTACRVQRVR